MTSTDHRPPLQAVYPPQHDDRAMWQRDRQRFAAFLTAKDLVLGYTRTATEGAGRVAARLHLEGLFTMVRRSYGWLLGAASVAAPGLRAPGVLAGLVWGLTTDVGQTLVGKAARTVSTAASTAAGAIGTAVGWTLRLFGTPGARLATWLGSKLTGVKQAATDRVQQLQRLSGLLRSQNLPAKAAAAIARGTPATDPGRALPAPPLVLAGPGRREHRAAADRGAPRRRHRGRRGRPWHAPHPGTRAGRHRTGGQRPDAPGPGADRRAG
jgi:hypothetical protein